MKRLIIIRHAKSDHGPQYQSDFERPLNARGRRDASLMAKALKKSITKLDFVLVSASWRTRQTASFFIDEYNLKQEIVDYSQMLYLPVEEEIWEVVRSEVDQDCQNVAVFTHNPAAEDLLHRFHPGTSCPTCSIIELHFDGEQWSDLYPDDARFISHKYPKLYV